MKDAARELIGAVEAGDLERVRSLLDQGVDVNAANAEGWTPLMIAAGVQLLGHRRRRYEETFLPMIDLLLAAGADPNRMNVYRRTALHEAVENRRIEVVRRLLAAGAVPDSVDGHGNRPLRYAIEQEHEALVRALIEAGASGDFTLQHPGWEGSTPLHWLIWKGWFDLVPPLLERGAPVDAADRAGTTPLMIAAARGAANLVQTLLTTGAAHDAQDQRGFTPLMRAAAAGHRRVVELLLAAGADPDRCNPAGVTARDLAQHAGHEEIVQLLRGSS